MNVYKHFIRLLPVSLAAVAILIVGAVSLNDTITVISENRPYTHRSVIIIDPGHGGKMAAPHPVQVCLKAV